MIFCGVQCSMIVRNRKWKGSVTPGREKFFVFRFSFFFAVGSGLACDARVTSIIVDVVCAGTSGLQNLPGLVQNSIKRILQ